MAKKRDERDKRDITNNSSLMKSIMLKIIYHRTPNQVIYTHPRGLPSIS